MNHETQEIISKLRKAGEKIARQHAHGSPYDRGSADRFYNRNYEPHWWPNGTGKGYQVPREMMTKDQIAEYLQGWREENDRKDWGNV